MPGTPLVALLPLVAFEFGLCLDAAAIFHLFGTFQAGARDISINSTRSARMLHT